MGPLLGLLLLLSFGPWAFNRLTSFVKSQIDSALTDVEVATIGLQFSTLAAGTELSWFLSSRNVNAREGDLWLLIVAEGHKLWSSQ